MSKGEMVDLPQKNIKTDPADLLIGEKLRQLRLTLGLTQEGLADKLGVSFQQVQKYEKGQNKLYATRLFHISRILNKNIDYFFESNAEGFGFSDQTQDGFDHEPMSDEPDDAEARALLRAFHRLKDKKKRKAAIEMIKAMAT